MRASGRARVREPTCNQQPQVFLGAYDRNRFCACFRCNNDFREDLRDGPRGFRIKRGVEHHDAAEGRGRIAGERLAISIDEASAFGDATRVGVLDDHAGRGARGRELGDALIGRVGVVDVVV